MAHRWNDQTGRYTDARGRFVSENTVRRVVDAVADEASTRMAAASQRLLNGELSLASWELEMLQTIKVSHVAAGILAHGGVEQMTFSRYGALGQLIRSEYQYLRQFSTQIKSGAQPLNGTMANRSRLYGQAARATFERSRGRDQQQRGYAFEQNVIHSGESCAGCRAESAKGVVPIGTLVPVGSRHPCLRNCKCSIRYSREQEVAA